MLGAEKLIDDQLELPSLPAIVIRLNELLDGQLPPMGRVSELISEDPALAAGVLRLVNSPLYPFQGKIDSLQRAVTLIGVREVRNLALAASVAGLGDGLTNPLFSIEQFWRHSLYVALISRGLATLAGQRDLDRYFVMGLLHDLGALVICHRRPEQARLAAQRSVEERRPLAEVEREVFGFSHADVGMQLLLGWGLPQSIAAAVGGHHAAAAEGEHRLAVAIVRLAELLAASLDEGYLGMGLREGVGISDWEQLGLRDTARDVLIRDAQAAFAGAYQAVFG